MEILLEGVPREIGMDLDEITMYMEIDVISSSCSMGVMLVCKT